MNLKAAVVSNHHTGIREGICVENLSFSPAGSYMVLQPRPLLHLESFINLGRGGIAPTIMRN